jgi:hypothetical protein
MGQPFMVGARVGMRSSAPPVSAGRNFGVVAASRAARVQATTAFRAREAQAAMARPVIRSPGMRLGILTTPILFGPAMSPRPVQSATASYSPGFKTAEENIAMRGQRIQQRVKQILPPVQQVSPPSPTAQPPSYSNFQTTRMRNMWSRGLFSVFY